MGAWDHNECRGDWLGRGVDSTGSDGLL
jgi:hypothetical protein